MLSEEFEKSLTRVFTSEYLFHADKAIKSALSAFKRGGRTQATVKKVNTSIAKQMAPFGKDASFQSDTEDAIADYYGENVKRFIKDQKLYVEKASMEGPKAAVNFTQKDVKAIEVISNLSNQSAGKYFPDQVQGKTSEVVSDVILDKGLTNEEAALKLQRELEGALGTKEAAQVVPTHYSTNPQAYFSIVTNNAALQANSVGRMIAMSDAEVEKYRIVAIIDKRTSNICRKLDGKEFEVKKAMSAVEKFLDVENLNDLQNLMPFNNKDEVPKWANEGLGFPPFHMKCRTTVIAAGI